MKDYLTILISFGTIVFAIAYVVSQLKVGKFKGDSELVKELIERVNGKEIIVKDQAVEIDRVTKLLKQESEQRILAEQKAKDLKKLVENRNPELLNILRADHDILIQVRKIEENISNQIKGGVK